MSVLKIKWCETLQVFFNFLGLCMSMDSEITSRRDNIKFSNELSKLSNEHPKSTKHKKIEMVNMESK